MSVDGLAPSDVRPSAGTVIAMFGSHLYTAPAAEGSAETAHKSTQIHCKIMFPPAMFCVASKKISSIGCRQFKASYSCLHIRSPSLRYQQILWFRLLLTTNQIVFHTKHLVKYWKSFRRIGGIRNDFIIRLFQKIIKYAYTQMAML